MKAPARADLLAAAGLLALSGGVAAASWTSHVQWKPDSLFYRAQVLRMQGVPKDEALRRVFEGPLAAPRRLSEATLSPAERKVSSPTWVRYSSRFYERRWLVPLVAAALDPAVGAQGLLAASLIGYMLVALCLYVLLRLWFGIRASLLAAAACLLLYPLRYWSGLPLTDSFGLAVECLALAAGVLVLKRGLDWLALWVVSVLALSFTRDASAVAVAGAVAAWAMTRSRTAMLLALSGIAAALPAPLAFGAPLRESMAYTLNGFYPPADSSWSFVVHHYLHGLRSLVRNDLDWLGNHPVAALVLVGGFACLPLLRGRGDGACAFVWAAAAAALVYDALVPNYTAFRLELVFIPFAALGLGAAASQLRWPRARPAVAQPP